MKATLTSHSPVESVDQDKRAVSIAPQVRQVIGKRL